MNRRFFVQKIIAFSFAIAALAFASCSNMGGDVASPIVLPVAVADGSSNPTTAFARLGIGRIEGNIQEDAGISRTVAPNASDVSSSVVNYQVTAWGTKADGSVVPASSPISGTVNTTARTFSIELEYGTWTVKADGLDTNGRAVLSKTISDLTLNAASPVANLSFALNYYQDAGVNGSLALPFSYASGLNIASISYELKPASGSSISGNVADVTIGSFTLDSTLNPSFGSLVPGIYSLVVKFLDSYGGTIIRLDQSVQIYSNLTTSKIDGTAPYINSGSVSITSDVVSQYQSSVIYVGGTGIGSPAVAANDSNNGTQYDPVASLGRALNIISNSSLNPADGFTVYIQADIGLSANLSISSDKKISFIGTNDSSHYKVFNSPSIGYRIERSDSALIKFNYIDFDRIYGFELDDGETQFTNCKITNGTHYASNDGGGGLCILQNGTKAVLQNCVIAGCVAEGALGGGIFVGGDAILEMTDCLVGAETTSCATDSAASNKAKAGGGINIDYGGSATLTNTKVLYNSCYGDTSSVGGGIRNCGSLTISGGQINHNYAYNGGGGLYTGGGSPSVTINNCLVGKEASSAATGLSDCGNYSAGEGGGGIRFAGGSLTTTDGFTVSKNYSATYGGGLYVGSSLTLSTGTISYNGAANGGGLNLASGENFTLSGGTVSANTASANGGAAYIDGTFTMSAGASIPGGTGGANDVYLCAGKTIAVGETLTADSPVATISHENFVTGTSVLSGTSITATICAKFAAKGGDFTIVPDGAGTAGVLALGTIYVDGTNGLDTYGGTSAAPFKTLYKAFDTVAGANCTIIVVNGTSETQALTIPATATGLTIQTNDGSQKDITGGSTNSITIDASGTTIKNLAFNSFAGINVRSSVTGVHLENVKIKDNHNDMAGGGLWLGGDAVVTASDLSLENCYVTSIGSGGGIYISLGASLTVDGLTMTDCRVTGDNSDGGGICNCGTLRLKDSVISGCTTTGSGAGIYSADDAVTILEGSANIANEIYLYNRDKPLLVTSDFALASGASVIPLKANIATGYYQFGDAALKGYDTYALEESKLSCFGMANTGVALVYDSSGTAPVGKLKDVTVTGGVSVSFSGNVSFVMTTPTASGEKARFNVIDNSSGTPTYVTPTSARIEVKQYGSAVYAANAQEVTATYLTEGEYELYCKAVIGGVVYDTTIPFAAGGKYTPLTLEAAQAGAVVTFDNKASGPVTYRVNGGTEQTIASGESKAITLDNIGDKVQFFGDNTAYATSAVTSSCSNIACNADCYVYGNIMSLVKSAGFESETALTDAYTFCQLFKDNAHIKNKTGDDLLLPATTMTEYCYHSMFYGCTSLTTAPELPSTTLSRYCYYSMFRGCTSLTTVPELPATTMKDYCYYGMFRGCTSLTAAPVLPATTLANNCYNYMFNGCTSLTAAPELPATTLANYCYTNMFEGCTSLTAASALPATTLANNCYASMFFGCTSLMTAPELPATTLAIFCYRSMFQGCSSLNSVTCLATDISASNCTTNWLSGVAASGTFTKAAGMSDWTIDSANGIPSGWVVNGGAPTGDYEALPAGTDGSLGTSGTYVTFGLWPQTIKASSVTVDESKTQSAGAFTYYKGSDNCWYAKLAENAYESGYTYSDGTTVGQGGTSEKYFKVEPIKWRVLTDDYSGKKLLLAESVLVNCKYYDTSDADRGSGVYPTNYKESRIRAYLNGLSYNKSGTTNSEFSGKGFLQTAFTTSQQSAIATTTVDNSAASTTDSGGNLTQATSYACDDTSDKIFLLSEREATTSAYGFAAYDASDSARIRVTTDYAKASGAEQSASSGMGGWWWLRSPYDTVRSDARGVSNDGYASYYNNRADTNYAGVVPALCLE